MAITLKTNFATGDIIDAEPPVCVHEVPDTVTPAFAESPVKL